MIVCVFGWMVAWSITGSRRSACVSADIVVPGRTSMAVGIIRECIGKSLDRWARIFTNEMNFQRGKVTALYVWGCLFEFPQDFSEPSLQVDRIALHGVTPHFCNCNNTLNSHEPALFRRETLATQANVTKPLKCGYDENARPLVVQFFVKK